MRAIVPWAWAKNPSAQIARRRDGTDYYQVPIIIDRIQVDVDINDGQIVAFAVDFSGNGPLH